MPIATKAILVLQGNQGRPENHQAKTVIRGAIDKASVATFKTFLESTITDCNFVQYAHKATQTSAGTSAPNAGVNVDRQGVFILRNNDSQTYAKFYLGGITDSATEQEQAGEGITPLAGSQFATALNTLLTGVTSYAFTSGYVRQVK